MPQTMSQTLPQTPALVCRTSGNKGGVASVLPFSASAARSGRVVVGKRRWYNKVRKMAVEHPPADLCPKPHCLWGKLLDPGPDPGLDPGRPDN